MAARQIPTESPWLLPNPIRTFSILKRQFLNTCHGFSDASLVHRESHSDVALSGLSKAAARGRHNTALLQKQGGECRGGIAGRVLAPHVKSGFGCHRFQGGAPQTGKQHIPPLLVDLLHLFYAVLTSF